MLLPGLRSFRRSVLEQLCGGLLAGGLVMGGGGVRAEPYLVPVYLPDGASDVLPLARDPALWEDAGQAQSNLLTALDHSLNYLATPEAEVAYAELSLPNFSREWVRRSLERFRTLLLASDSPEALQQAVLDEFALYQSRGQGGRGEVHFTGYFEPSYLASRRPDERYRYPLYRRPPDLEAWTLPHPTRADLEGVDGLQGAQGPLAGLELVWLSDRLQAFLVQVQGSARFQLPDGEMMAVGYAGRTEYPYNSIGRALIDDGEIAAEELSLAAIKAYFQAHPEALDEYLPRNQRFIFFRETDGGPPLGTFSIPVTEGRSIATDKSLMPPGALALIALPLPTLESPNDDSQPVHRFVLNQDTGGAIQGPGRVDIFVGGGSEAGDLAGEINTYGQLFFLLLRNPELSR